MSDETSQKIEQLRQFRDSEGYKILGQLCSDRFNECVAKILEPNPELLKIEAEMKAWSSVLQLVSMPIMQFDEYTAQQAEQQRLLQLRNGAQHV